MVSCVPSLDIEGVKLSGVGITRSDRTVFWLASIKAGLQYEAGLQYDADDACDTHKDTSKNIGKGTQAGFIL